MARFADALVNAIAWAMPSDKMFDGEEIHGEWDDVEKRIAQVEARLAALEEERTGRAECKHGVGFVCGFCWPVWGTDQDPPPQPANPAPSATCPWRKPMGKPERPALGPPSLALAIAAFKASGEISSTSHQLGLAVMLLKSIERWECSEPQVCARMALEALAEFYPRSLSEYADAP